jgi:hypothetical protein
MKPLLLTFTMFFSLSGLAIAHNGVEHLRGTVTEISDKTITIQTPARETKTISLLADTTFLNGAVAATAKSVKVGDKVVVDVVMKGKDMTAKAVKFGAAPRTLGAAEHQKAGQK